MGINGNPAPVVCGNRWRHQSAIPPATVMVKSPDLIGWAPRCEPCLKTLAGSATLIDAVEVGPLIYGFRDDDPRDDGRPALAEP